MAGGPQLWAPLTYEALPTWRWVDWARYLFYRCAQVVRRKREGDPQPAPTAVLCACTAFLHLAVCTGLLV